MAINIDKIVKELSKGNPDELLAAFNEIKSFVTLEVQEERERLQDKASELQSSIDKINGN